MSETFEVPAGVPLFDTLEEAALAGWRRSPGAEARVVEVRPTADEQSVWVVVQLGARATAHHDQEVVTCVRAADGRWWAGGSTGSSSAE